jgi:lysozyme
MQDLLGKPRYVRPEFDDLSPDLQWQIATRWERLELILQLGCLTLLGALIAPMAIPGLNRQMDIALHEGRDIKLFGITVYTIPPALETLGIIPPEALQPIKAGDVITGYTINSGYGDRWHPIYQENRFHSGVDAPMETGTKIYAPGQRRSRVKVDCLSPGASGGGGLTAVIESPDIPGKQLLAMHLSRCATGLHPGGSVIAASGGDPADPNAGDSTGPHLHWSEKEWMPEENQWVTVHPKKGFLQWALTGTPPQTLQDLVIPKTAEELIKSFEGFHRVPYWDYQQWSSGYGTKAASPDEVIDEATAEKRLQDYIDQAATDIQGLVTVPLSQNQLDALISFQYNTGGLAGSTLLAKLNQGDYAGAAAEFEAWVHADGEVLPGLVTRRRQEKQLFLSAKERGAARQGE